MKHRNRGRYEADLAGTHKTLRKVLTAARRAGATVTLTGSGHYQIRTETGVVHASSTPHAPDHTAKLLRQQLRKIGIDV